MTAAIPKALADINGEPFVAHQLRLLRAHQIDRVVLCVGYLGEMIRDAIGDGTRFGLHVEYVFDGPIPLETAGAIKKALPLLGEAFFVLYGDSYLPCDYEAVRRAFAQSGKPALMTVFRNQGQWDRSNVEFENGRIIAYEKDNPTPRMRHIDYGLGAFQSSAFASMPVGEPHDLAALYRDLLRRGELAGFEVSQRFYEVGSFEGLRETANFIARQGVERQQWPT
jgi:NDP-sugar pyrophosphorylase family protein